MTMDALLDNQWHDLTTDVLDQLRLHNFTKRERLVIEALIDLSFAIGQPFARIARLADIGELTGMSKGQVKGVLDGLQLAGVIRYGAGEYQILPQSPIHAWKIKPRLDGQAYASKRAAMASHSATDPKQLDLLEPEPDLKRAIDQACIEAAVPKSGTATSGFRNPEPTRRNPVPDSGTLPENIVVSRQVESAEASGVGTLNVQRLNALSKRTDVVRLNVPVPNSGTSDRIDLDLERRLMNWVEEIVGADDMAYYGGPWRLEVRKYPDAVERAVLDARERMKTGWKPGNPGAALYDVVKRFSGRK